MKSKQRFIEAIEITKNDAVIVLDDGSTLGGIISVNGTAQVGAISFANITAYIVNENTILPEDDDDKTKH